MFLVLVDVLEIAECLATVLSQNSQEGHVHTFLMERGE